MIDALTVREGEAGSRCRRTALLLAVVTFSAYMVGSDRAFGYDAAVTMENFVDGPPARALTRQIVWNNHPMFSLIQSLTADIAGTGEVAMRVLPALFASAAVGILIWRIGLHWGLLSGAAAGLVTATHPLLIDMSRDVRGYSLAVLCIVVMAVAVVDLGSPPLFAAAAVIGIGSHLYAAVPFAALVGLIVAGGLWSPRWRLAVLSAAVGTAFVHCWTLGVSLETHSDRIFRPTFPTDAGWALLGGNWATVAIFGAFGVVGATRLSWSSGRRVAASVLVAGVAVPWVVGPHHLYPRFIYWAIPALAVAVASVVRHRPAALAPVALGCIFALVPELASWNDDPFPNRELASRMAESTCAAPSFTSEALVWYSGRNPDECTSIAFLGRPDMLKPGSRLLPDLRLLRTGWPVECWAADGSEIRAKHRADCPWGPRSGRRDGR